MEVLPKLKKDDIVVWRTPIEELDFDQLDEIYKELKKIFSNNILISIPINSDIEILDKEYLIEIRDYISEIIRK